MGLFNLFNHTPHKRKSETKAEIRPEIIAVSYCSNPPSYIETVDDVLNINYNQDKQKEEKPMIPEIDLDKAVAYFEDVQKQRDDAVNNALLGLNAAVEEEINKKKAEIEAEVKARLIAQAEGPFIHDLELYNKLKVQISEDEVEVDPVEASEDNSESAVN